MLGETGESCGVLCQGQAGKGEEFGSPDHMPYNQTTHGSKEENVKVTQGGLPIQTFTFAASHGERESNQRDVFKFLQSPVDGEV